MLKGVVESGTGTNAKIAGYDVAGKTGTARKPPYDKPPFRYVASFAGFAPVDTPRLSAIVVLDEPQGNYFGGQVAAPAFARIMEFALRAERVLPGVVTPALPPAPAAPPPQPNMAASGAAPSGASTPADTLTPAP
jgi:cell division protein FtsI/penicillin-binding protein 2